MSLFVSNTCLTHISLAFFLVFFIDIIWTDTIQAYSKLETRISHLISNENPFHHSHVDEGHLKRVTSQNSYLCPSFYFMQSRKKV